MNKDNIKRFVGWSIIVSIIIGAFVFVAFATENPLWQGLVASLGFFVFVGIFCLAIYLIDT